MRRISLLIPDMPTADDILPWLRKIDQAKWYTNFGPLNLQFEQALLSYFNSSLPLYITTVANNTLGLELALQALHLAPYSKVLIPAFTFVATGTAVLRSQLSPLLADIDEKTWLLTPAIAREVLKTHPFQAVMPVTSLGYTQDVHGWDKFTEDTGIPVIIDAAACFGNQNVGNTTNLVVSLHATKALGCGEGGYVVSTNENFVNQIKNFSNFGIDLSTPEHLVYQAGTNAKLSEYHAAVGLASLMRWEIQQEKRHALSRMYHHRLKHLHNEITFQFADENIIPSIFVIRLHRQRNIAPIMAALDEKGIQTRRWYYPTLFEQPAFSHCERAGNLTYSEIIPPQILGIPFHLSLTEDDINYVCSTLEHILLSRHG